MNMPKTKLSRTRRWIGASVLALSVAGGGAVGVMLTEQQAYAQVHVQNSNPMSFAPLVSAVKPAVVSIDVNGVEKVQGGGHQFNFNMPDLPPGSPFRRFFEQFGQPGAPNRSIKRRFEAAGSGFIISADGYVVTNNHVVKNANKVTVITDTGKKYDATIVGTDPKTDLALLKLKNAHDMTYVELADKPVRVGDWVVAVGNPFGLGGTVTAGIVSARGRDLHDSSYGDYLQIDAPINRGNSGGPDFNLEGKVVGVNTAIYTPNGGNVGIAFSIPASTVRTVIAQLKAKGEVTRGFLGVSIQDVTQDIANSVGLKTAEGALVAQPTPGSPAAKAGIKSGDVITAVDGKPIKDAQDLSRTIGNMQPGTTIKVTIWRDGGAKTLSVTLDTLKSQVAGNTTPQKPTPNVTAPAPAKTSVGLTLVPNADGPGLLVQSVEPNSPAANKGFAVGDLILEANNTPMKNPSDFETAVKAVKAAGRNTILVKASRDGNARFIGLPLENR